MAVDRVEEQLRVRGGETPGWHRQGGRWVAADAGEPFETCWGDEDEDARLVSVVMPVAR